MSIEHGHGIPDGAESFSAPDETRRIEDSDVAEVMARNLVHDIKYLQAAERNLQGTTNQVERAQVVAAFEVIAQRTENVFGGPQYQNFVTEAANGTLEKHFQELAEQRAILKDEIEKTENEVPTFIDAVGNIIKRLSGSPVGKTDSTYQRLLELHRKFNAFDVDYKDAGDILTTQGSIQMSVERGRLDQATLEWQAQYKEEIEAIKNLDEKSLVSQGAAHLMKARPAKIALDLIQAQRENEK